MAQLAPQPHSDGGSGDDGSWSRRTLLKTGATVAAAGLGTLAGCTDDDLDETDGTDTGKGGALGTAGPPWALNPETYAGLFDRVVVATDVGADPNGEQAIDPILNAELRPGTLLHFPEGVYKMNSSFRMTGHSGNIGVTGDHAVIQHGEVRAINGHTVTEGEFQSDTRLFNIGNPSTPHAGDFVFGGLIFDWGWSEHAGMQGLNLHTTGTAEVRNISFHGVHSLGTHGSIRAATLADDSLAMFSNIDMSWGGLHYENTINQRATAHYSGARDVSGRVAPSWSTSGFTIGSEQRGTMFVEDVVCGPWPDNGLYLKGGYPETSVGRKILRNCIAFNSNVSNIRVNSGNDWEPIEWIDGDDPNLYDRTVVENCHVVVDQNYDSRIYGNQRGVRLDDGDPLIRDSLIELVAPNGEGLSIQLDTNEATAERVQVDLYEPETAIRATGTNPIVRDAVVNMYGFDDVERVLSNVSRDAVALNAVST